MPVDSESEIPPVYDPAVSQNHLFRNAKGTELHPGTLMSLDNGPTPAFQTMFDGATNIKSLGGLYGANLSDSAKAQYGETISGPYAKEYLALRKADLELRREELAFKREELEFQKGSSEKASEQALLDLVVKKDEIAYQRQLVAYQIEELRRKANTREASDFNTRFPSEYPDAPEHNYPSTRPSANLRHQSSPQASAYDRTPHPSAFPRWQSHNNARGADEFAGQYTQTYENTTTPHGGPHHN